MSDLEALVNELASIIKAPEDCLPTFEKLDDMARPFIRCGSDFFEWIIRERGQILDRRQTKDVDEVLWWTFDNVTSSMASDWEMEHRVEGQDHRILLFIRKFELLGQLSSDWEDRARHRLLPLISSSFEESDRP